MNIFSNKLPIEALDGASRRWDRSQQHSEFLSGLGGTASVHYNMALAASGAHDPTRTNSWMLLFDSKLDAPISAPTFPGGVGSQRPA
jgi:hypothetical protein